MTIYFFWFYLNFLSVLLFSSRYLQLYCQKNKDNKVHRVHADILPVSTLCRKNMSIFSYTKSAAIRATEVHIRLQRLLYLQNDHEQQNSVCATACGRIWIAELLHVQLGRRSPATVTCHRMSSFLFGVWPEAKGIVKLIMPSLQKKWPIPPTVPSAPAQRRTVDVSRITKLTQAADFYFMCKIFSFYKWLYVSLHGAPEQLTRFLLKGS